MAQAKKNGKSASTKKTSKKARSRARAKTQPSSSGKSASPPEAVEPPPVTTMIAQETTAKAIAALEEAPAQTPQLPEEGSEVIMELMKMPTFRQMVIARIIKKMG